MLRNVKVGGIQRGDRRTAEEAQSTFHIITQNLERACDTRPSGSSEAESISTAEENGSCAKTNRFYDIATSANPAIHKDFGSTVDGGNHLGEHSQRGWSAVQLTSTVIRNDDRGRSFGYGTFGIVGSEHSLDDNRPGPDALEPANVFPGDNSPGKSSR